MKEFQVKRIKDHLFNKTHQLDDGVRKFDADPQIANAWKRLEDGNFTEKDIQLLKHELFESKKVYLMLIIGLLMAQQTRLEDYQG